MTTEERPRSRAIHYPRVVDGSQDIAMSPDGRFQAICSKCSWKGLVRLSRGAAEADADRHWIRNNPPGPIA